MDRRTLLLSVPAVALVGTGGWTLWSQDSAGPSLGSVSAQAAADIDTSGIPEMAIGSPDAKVTVIEYASFTCPHCRNFHATVYGRLKQNYIDMEKSASSIARSISTASACGRRWSPAAAARCGTSASPT